MKILLPFVCGLLSASVLHAQISLSLVTVGHPGNPADSTGFGSVGYPFAIGTYEVTNDQYAALLNAVADSDPNGLYSTLMGSFARGGITRSGIDGNYTYAVKPNMGNKPVVYVSYFDTLRFANWLQNGQPTGPQTNATTENGAYSLFGPTSATGRNANALYWLPTQDEWYKAAYYQPAALGGDSDSYWLYPTRSNTAPTLAVANATGDIVNGGANVMKNEQFADWNAQDGNVTTVGGALSGSYYGTFDQGGNVWEVTETLGSGSTRIMLGTSWFTQAAFAQSTSSSSTFDTSQFDTQGFRIAGVPEPTAGVLIITGALFFLRRRTLRTNDGKA